MTPGARSSASWVPTGSGDGVGRLMRRVLYALLPAVAVLTWLFGWGVLINIGLASALALLLETVLLALRGRRPAPALADGSALVTAWLLALCLPPLVPWWLTAVAVSTALVLGKHVYGGLGSNPFNPAMVGYAVVLVSFPLEMTAWPAPGGPEAWPALAAATSAVLGGHGPLHEALTGATPLDLLRTRLLEGMSVQAVLLDPRYGYLAGAGWEWVSAAFLLGGLWLVWTGSADWRIPASMLATLAVLAWLLHTTDPARHAPAAFHLFAGATMMGAFFVATDPVTACSTPLGRWIYGAGVGLLTLAIRSFGGYPDGIAFAVLLMNLAAPAIDHFSVRRARAGPP